MYATVPVVTTTASIHRQSLDYSREGRQHSQAHSLAGICAFHAAGTQSAAMQLSSKARPQHACIHLLDTVAVTLQWRVQESSLQSEVAQLRTDRDEAQKRCADLQRRQAQSLHETRRKVSFSTQSTPFPFPVSQPHCFPPPLPVLSSPPPVFPCLCAHLTFPAGTHDAAPKLQFTKRVQIAFSLCAWGPFFPKCLLCYYILPP